MTVKRPKTVTDRKNKIGGTNIAGIMGLAGSPYREYLRITDPESHAPTNQALMDYGLFSEAFFADQFEKEYGVKLKKTKAITKKGRPYLRGNPDRLTEDGKLVEIKTTTPQTLSAMTPDEDIVPVRWNCQVQYYMWLGDIDTCYIVVGFRDSAKMRVFQIDADKDFQTEMEKKITHFYKEHVKKGIPPEPTEPEDVASYYPVEEPDSQVEIDETEQKIIDELRVINQVLKVVEYMKQDRLGKIMVSLGSKEKLVDSSGRVLAEWKARAQPSLREDELFKDHPEYREKFATFDKKAFREALPDEYEKYRAEPKRAKAPTVKLGALLSDSTIEEIMLESPSPIQELDGLIKQHK